MASTSSPSMLSKLLLKKGSNPYKDLEISRTTTAETPPQPSFSAVPAEYSLLDVICDEERKLEREQWVEWLENEDVPSDIRVTELCGRDRKGWTALHHAARHSCTEILDCAADVEGIDMNITTHGDQLTPLLVAAKYGVKDSIVSLLEKTIVETSAVTVEGQNALHLVVQNQECVYSIQPLLWQLDRKLWIKPDHLGNIPLHVACEHGNLDALQQGLFRLDIWQAEERSVDSDGGSEAPSDAAVSEGGSEGEERSDAEARIADEEPGDEQDEDGGPPDSMWIAEQLKEMILTTNNCKQTPLHLAAENDHDKVVAVLIDKCREVIKCQDEDGDMALHLACRRGHLDVVSKILEWEPTTIGNKYTNNKGETAVHCAAYNSGDNGRLMEHLMCVCKQNSTLDTQDILCLHENESRHTPLMLACTKGKPEVVKVLLHHGADVTQREKEMDLAGQEQETLNSLELAIENGRREVAKVIIDGLDWRRSLRTSNIIDRVANTPFRRMIRKMPDIALVVLDKCTREINDRDDVHFEMEFDYEFVEDFYIDGDDTSPHEKTKLTNVTFCGGGSGSVGSVAASVSGKGRREGGVEAAVELKEVKVLDSAEDKEDGTTAKRSAARGDDTDGATSSKPPDEEWKPREYDKQNHVLNIMVENNRSQLLQHPLVTTLLNHKWSQFGAWIYFANLLFYLIYVIFLTAFALVVPNPQSVVCTCISQDSRNDTRCDDALEKCVSTTRSNFLYFAAVVTIVLAVARLIVEVFQLLHWTQSKHPNCCGTKYQLYVNWDYWLDWTNYLEITLYVFSIVFVIVFDDCFCPNSSQWQVGTVAVFFAWIDVLLFLYKLPKIGIYVGMMLQITRRFLNVVILAVLLSLAFGFAFYMAFYEPTILASPFANPVLSFIKLMVMTSGGPDDSIFRYQNEGSGARSELPFPEVAFFIWVIFIVIMTILFVNFLVGLAVDDVKQIQQSATLRRLSLKVDLVLSMEQVFPILHHHKWFAIKSHKVCPNKRLLWYKRLWKKFYSLVWDDDVTASIHSSLNPEEDTDYKVDSLRNTVEQLVVKHLSQEKMLADILKEVRKQNKQVST